MTWFLSTFFWLLLVLGQFIAGLLFRAFTCVLWLLWPVVIMGFLMASAQSAEAGWFSWLWGSNTRQLERSLDVAQEAARVASQAAEAQAMQAAAQADQNSRVAEAVAQLSAERQDYAGHLRAISELALWDSQLAAALNASGPVLVCVFGLTVAGLALWLVTRNEATGGDDFPGAVDMLLEELATGLPEDVHEHGRHCIGQAGTRLPRLPLIGVGERAGPDQEKETEMPF